MRNLLDRKVRPGFDSCGQLVKTTEIGERHASAFLRGLAA
jgi:hypothetical protein